MKFRSRLVVNLDHLTYNYSQIKKMAPQSEILFMVKADGYGHGMVPIVRHAVMNLNITEFGCASLAEALKLREELSDLEFDIYVFSDIQIEFFENFEFYLKLRILPVLASMAALDFVLHTPELNNLPICLKFNTGMNRLGFDPESATQIIGMLKRHGRLSVHHLISHFANSTHPMNEHGHNLLQRSHFREIKKLFTDSGIRLERTSQSNSGATEQKIGLGEEGDTHIRPGLMMYGPTSLAPEYSDYGFYQGKIISKLETYIIRTFSVKKGDLIGYGSTPCPYDGVIGVLAIGYGDGFSTRYSGAHVNHLGFEGIIFGRVNMDMTQVLFPIESADALKAGDVFTIWGEQDGDLLRFSTETKTIPYEIFCSLLPRVSRVYRLD